MRKENNNKKIVHIIAGPTASGKSARAIERAEELNGVVINCDSMQIYDGLQILTAQPPMADQERMPHTLYSHLHPDQICSAGNWRELVEPVIQSALSEDRTPIIVGGSGLYIKALTDGLSPMPDVPQEVRDQAVALQKKLGNPAFYEALHKRDPVMAERFHPFHTARLVRAWEVLEATGMSLAEWQKKDRLSPPDDWHFEIEVIIPPRPVLHERCNLRFMAMIEAGVLDEVAAFAERIEKGEVRADVPLTKALGYKQLLSYIRGELGKEEAIAQAQAKTRQYAKQQVTWFRNQI